MDPRALRTSAALKMLSSPKYWLTIVALAAGCAPLVAQQPYSPYGAGNGQYAGQYVAPSGQPYGYGQPQYGQPQYQQSQYGQPQYGQPQYQQPQQYEQPQYSQGQPYAQQPSYAQQLADPQQDPQQYVQPQQPLSADQLEQLVAPIALYPDQLLAQILTASTYPAQVAVANQWLRQMQAQGAASPDQIAQGANSQSNWDPSVKALTAFPQVLDTMDQNLEWTTNLGNAYYNQPQDVMQTVQVLRQRAEDAGNLQNTPQEQMTYDQGAIELAPPNPQTVYVPQYNPWDVYGAPSAPYPGFSLLGALGSFLGGAPINYGLGIGMAAFDRMPWGLLGWAFDWLGQQISLDNNSYFTHSTSVADWGYPRGGARAYGGWARDPRFASAGRGGQGYARAGYDERGQSFGRPAQQFSRPEQQFGRTTPQISRPESPISRPTPQFTRPVEGFTANQRRIPAESPRGSFDRSYQAQGYGAVRPAMPAQQAYNRGAEPISRPQPYAASPYAGSPYAGRPEAYGNANRPAQTYPSQTYARRPGMNYGSPSQSFRAPQAAAPRTFAQAQPRAFGGFSSAPQRSSGFSGFGRGSEPRGNSGSFGGKAPKSFGGGGGNFKAPKAPKESHSGGGGHRR